MGKRGILKWLIWRSLWNPGIQTTPYAMMNIPSRLGMGLQWVCNGTEWYLAQMAITGKWSTPLGFWATLADLFLDPAKIWGSNQKNPSLSTNSNDIAMGIRQKCCDTTNGCSFLVSTHPFGGLYVYSNPGPFLGPSKCCVAVHSANGVSQNIPKPLLNHHSSHKKCSKPPTSNT